MSQENEAGSDLHPEDYRAIIRRIIDEEIVSGGLDGENAASRLTNRLVEELTPFLEAGSGDERIAEDVPRD